MQSESLSVEQTLKQRGAEYGDWREDARVADTLISVCENTDNWNKLPPFMRQSIRLICIKLGRILSGNPHNRDSWHDIQGYAKLAEDRCESPVVIDPAKMRPEDLRSNIPGTILRHD